MWSAFNPTLVRLGASTTPASKATARTLSIPLWFDWGKGSLKVHQPVGRLAFNPTLVRLGGGRWSGAPGSLAPFNPTLVRLGAVEEIFVAGDDAAFNPTLVRLGVDDADLIHAAEVDAFNPTLVRLGARHSSPRRNISLRLSIPLWFDWGL